MGAHMKSEDTDEMKEKPFNISPEKELDDEEKVSNLVPNSKCSMKEEQGSEPLSVQKSEEFSVAMVQELRDCLPIWITQDDVLLDLLTRSNGNIVEAVSDFYERETEYHEQVISFRRNLSTKTPSPASLPYDELVSSQSSSNQIITWNQETKKTTNVSSSNKKIVSPKKRGSGKYESKSKKKVRPRSTLEQSGPKQSTITKFFSKVPPDGS